AALVIGGVSMGAQVRAVQNGVDVLVATPGRLLDLVTSNVLRLGDVEFLVLDEADRMLDMGLITTFAKSSRSFLRNGYRRRDLALRLRRGGVPARHREADPHVHSGDGPPNVSATGSAVDGPRRQVAALQTAAGSRQRAAQARSTRCSVKNSNERSRPPLSGNVG